MKKDVLEFAEAAGIRYNPKTAAKITKFAQLMLADLIKEINAQPNPQNLNYRPSETYAYLVQNHFDLEINEFTGVKFSKVSKHTDVMTLKEFEEACEMIMFTQDDGDGYFMKSETEESNISVWGYETPSWATHVAWYNK